MAIYPVAASGVEDKAEYVMRLSAMLTQGNYCFLTDDSGVGSAHAEPHIPDYFVQRLNHLMIRLIRSELVGRRIQPEPGRILRTVGDPGRVEPLASAPAGEDGDACDEGAALPPLIAVF